MVVAWRVGDSRVNGTYMTGWNYKRPMAMARCYVYVIRMAFRQGRKNGMSFTIETLLNMYRVVFGNKHLVTNIRAFSWRKTVAQF